MATTAFYETQPERKGTDVRVGDILTLRYLWETGVRNSLEGSTFVLIASFPIPSVPLQ